jgi:nitrate reductase assembly molybdenum cofactor insertion protein NarJ
MTAFTTLAPLFRYPDEAYTRRLDEARAAVDDPDLDEFASAIAQLDLPAQQATYTSTFDLAPSCSPYLGVHLFGDENRDRARLMLGLRTSYVRSGVACDGELPDHIAEVFAFSPYAESEEWDELRCLVVVPALTKMDEILRPTSNPYRLLVSAALHHSRRGGDS